MAPRWQIELRHWQSSTTSRTEVGGRDHEWPARFVHSDHCKVYNHAMDVGIAELRAHLGEWLDHARNGHGVVVTDRGIPVAKLVGIQASDAIECLTIEGLISRPSVAIRPNATSRRRPRANSDAQGTVADLVSEQRR